MGYKKYFTEAVSRVELMFGCLTKHDTPMVASDHPELDDTKILPTKYPCLQDLGMVKNGTEGHLEIDLSRKLKDHYPDTEEVIDDKVHVPLLDEFTITTHVDSDHAHDKMTRRSITRLIIFVGRTPVIYQSKRQGEIETSRYGAKFMAMKTAVEEVMVLCYMMRCLSTKKKYMTISYHMAWDATTARIEHPLKTK
eukprot:15364505-Ditylum_brightwellii.AAC.1